MMRFSPGCNCCDTGGLDCTVLCNASSTAGNYEIVVPSDALLLKDCTQAECDAYEGTHILVQNPFAPCTFDLALVVCGAYGNSAALWDMTFKADGSGKTDLIITFTAWNAGPLVVTWKKSLGVSPVDCNLSSESVPYVSTDSGSFMTCVGNPAASDIVVTAA